MVQSRYDVVGIGNAIVDVLSHAEDARLAELGIAKGAMTLIDGARASSVYAGIGQGHECSGGSAANTVAGLAVLGGRGAFIGKVADDPLGHVFRRDLTAIGVACGVGAAGPDASGSGEPTARCLILVTPDAQRTMMTHLGVSVELGPDDIDAELIDAALVTYLEGYLWDPPDAKAAMRHAAARAHGAGRMVALTLSDSFCVDRHRDDFRALMRGDVDVLFANESEITALYQCGFEEAIRLVRDDCAVAAITRGEKGSVVVAGDTVIAQHAEPVDRVVDTTGAGDLYAAGFLFGYTHGFELGAAAQLGGICAAEIIGHVGARPQADLKTRLAALQGHPA